MRIDTDSPDSSFNWTAAKQSSDLAETVKFIPERKPNMNAQFVDFDKKPIKTLEALEAKMASAGWHIPETFFLLITERKTLCILELDLQSKLCIPTSQRPATKTKSIFDVLQG